MPLLWRRRLKPQEDEDVRSTDKGESRKSRRKSLRDVFGPSEATHMKLTQIKLAEDSSINQKDVLPPPRIDSKLTPKLANKEGQDGQDEDFSQQTPNVSSGEDTLVESGVEDMEDGEMIQAFGEEDVRTLFAGAAKYSTLPTEGTIKPYFDFPWDSDIEVNDVRDCPPLAHTVYSSTTLQPHLTIVDHGASLRGAAKGYDTDATEIPEMLGAKGSEAGTVGLGYFLQLPLSDNLGAPEVAAAKGDLQAVEQTNQHLFRADSETLGLRKLDMGTVSDRLTQLGDTYHKCRSAKKTMSILDKQLPDELYDILFRKLLTPTKLAPASEDPTTLKVQIEPLIRILNLPGIWADFSQVELRIRLGQLLWAEQEPPEDPETPGGNSPSERDKLLLQITLASELLLRLDAIAGMTVSEVNQSLKLSQEDMNRFRSLETRKLKWDLVLARRFLDNVLVVPTKRKEEKRQPRSLRRFFMPFSTDSPKTPEYDEYPDVMLLPRNQERQLEGLKHFALSLAWSDYEALEFVLTTKFPPILAKRPNLFRSGTTYATPLASPRARSPAQGTDYFNSRPLPSSREPSAVGLRPPPVSRGCSAIRPQMSRDCPSQRSFQLQSPNVFMTPAQSPTRTSCDRGNPAITINGEHEPQHMPTGWLTRAYLTGIILPGESLQHHLISALLENSPAAMMKLGDTATLYGGFVYAKRSYWSRSCIVGRVIACKKGSNEGWGWMGTSVVPTINKKWSGEGWIDIEAAEPPGMIEDLATGKEARIKQRKVIENDSDVLAGKDTSEVKPEHFTLPVDSPTKPRSTLWFDGLRLQRLPDAAPTQPVDLDGEGDPEPPATYKASISFSSMSLSSEIGSPTVLLRYDVYFISAVPCTPPPTDKLRLILKAEDDEVVETKVPAHPLHVSQRYRIVAAGELLKKTFKWPEATPPESNEGATGGREVLILDTRGSEELELLARAWCASKGEHAVLGRVGVTCLACCVREARGAGVSVVIRVG